MHPQALSDWQSKEDMREIEHAIRLAKIAGIKSPEDKIEPELSGLIRFNDPPQAELWRAQARNDLIEEAITKLESVEPDTANAPMTSLEEIDGVGPDLAQNLKASGYETPDDLREASDEELLAVDGVGPAKLKQIREDLA